MKNNSFTLSNRDMTYILLVPIFCILFFIGYAMKPYGPHVAAGLALLIWALRRFSIHSGWEIPQEMEDDRQYIYMGGNQEKGIHFLSYHVHEEMPLFLLNDAPNFIPQIICDKENKPILNTYDDDRVGKFKGKPKGNITGGMLVMKERKDGIDYIVAVQVPIPDSELEAA